MLSFALVVSKGCMERGLTFMYPLYMGLQTGVDEVPKAQQTRKHTHRYQRRKESGVMKIRYLQTCQLELRLF